MNAYHHMWHTLHNTPKADEEWRCRFCLSTFTGLEPFPSLRRCNVPPFNKDRASAHDLLNPSEDYCSECYAQRIHEKGLSFVPSGTFPQFGQTSLPLFCLMKEGRLERVFNEWSMTSQAFAEHLNRVKNRDAFYYDLEKFFSSGQPEPSYFFDDI